MGCRHYFVADRLEALVDEGDSRSSSRLREHGCFRLVSQLHVAIPDTLEVDVSSSRCVHKSIDCSLPTGRTVLTRSASTFSPASLSLSERSTDTLVLSQPSKKRLSISCTLQRDGGSVLTGRPVLTI